jgi:hypothetical protein
MHPIQDLFLESFSYVLQFDMHSYVDKIFHSCKKWVLQILRAISLIHDLAAKLKVLWSHKAFLEPYNSIGILSEALLFSQVYSSVEMAHSNVRSLDDDDVFFDSWNKGYVV